MAEQKKLLTTSELADYFSLSRWSIYRAVKSGKLKVTEKRGTVNMFSEQDIQDYLNLCMQERE